MYTGIPQRRSALFSKHSNNNSKANHLSPERGPDIIMSYLPEQLVSRKARKVRQLRESTLFKRQVNTNVPQSCYILGKISHSNRWMAHEAVPTFMTIPSLLHLGCSSIRMPDESSSPLPPARLLAKDSAPIRPTRKKRL